MNDAGEQSALATPPGDRTGPDDPAFPHLHGRPPRGWVNDPNGLCRVDGRYHVFFQHNPDRPRHEHIHWGHVSSADLLTWRAEPVALAPRAGEIDAFGCWSGCIVLDDDLPTAVYSAVTEDSGHSAVVLATSHDGLRTWQADVEPVAEMPVDDAITDMRDPFIFTVQGRRFAVQGAGDRNGSPALIVHSCDDLDAWTPRGLLLTGGDPIAARIAPANVWECPNLFQLGNRWILVVSLWESLDNRHTLSGVRWLLGDLELTHQGPRFHPFTGGMLDDGPCFYAPQVLVDDDRILLWAWAWEHGRLQPDIDRMGWAGALTFPRELTLVDDVVVSRPAAELRGLRQDVLEVQPGRSFTATAFELSLPTGCRVRLRLVHPAHDGATADSSIDVGTWLTADDPVDTPPCILVDGSMVEVFPGGPISHTTRAYPTGTSHWVIDVDGRPPTDRADLLHGWHLGQP